MANKRGKKLGLDQTITRRDFVYGSSLLVGGALSGCATGGSQEGYGFDVGKSWYGPGGVGDYAPSHGNTPGVVGVAHEIRSGRFNGPLGDASDSGEFYDLVVVGGGFSGLSAAFHFNRLHPGGKALILDNHPIFGGEAKRNEFDVDGYHVTGPQGSNDFAIQKETGGPDDYFTALNIPREFDFAEPQGAASGMRIPYDNFDYMAWQQDSFDVAHFFDGADPAWVRDIWSSGLSSTPWSNVVQQAFRRLRDTETPGDTRSDTWLDSMTLRAYYEDVLNMPPQVSDYYDPIMASIAGLGCDGLSAYWGRAFEMPGFLRPDDYEAEPLISFPGGNAALARHFVKKMIPAAISASTFEGILNSDIQFGELDRNDNPIRIRLDSTAVRVEHETDDRVAITYSNNGKLHRLRAKSVVMASGGWVNRHVIADLPQGHHEAYNEFVHAPVLVANVALRNWRFLERLGLSAAIWSGGFGFTCNIRRPMVVGGKSEPLDPDKPIVLTFYAPIFKPGLAARQQGAVARAEMLSTSFADYEQQIREQMTMMFSAGGFDAARDIAGVILNRWGHAYVAPGPGFMFGRNGNMAPPDVIRQRIGRIAIGHSELRGHQYWSGAAGEGRRAVESLLDSAP